MPGPPSSHAHPDVSRSPCRCLPGRARNVPVPDRGPPGRPAALGARDLGRARSWRGEGVTDAAIGKRLGVHGSTVARVLVGVERPGSDAAAQAPTLPVAAEPDNTETTEAHAGVEPTIDEPAPAPVASPAGSAAIGTGVYR